MKKQLSLLTLALTIAFVIWYGFNTPLSQSLPNKDNLVLDAATMLSPAKPVSAFSLTDTEGNTFTEKSLIGHWTLMFFGYAECPNICPATLATVASAWNLLPTKIQDNHTIRFVFVSLDPESDTIEKLRTFLGRFHTSFMGLTGEASVIKQLSKDSSIYSWQDPATSANGPKIIDHSATLLLINPQGRVEGLFSPPHKIEAIANDLQLIIQKK